MQHRSDRCRVQLPRARAALPRTKQ